MSSNYSTIQQHQPLRVPQGWGTQEKALIVQLDEIFDDLYKRFNRLRIEDLSKDFRKRIEDDEGNIASITIDVGQIDARVTTAEGGISALTVSVGQISTEVSNKISKTTTLQTADQIVTAATSAAATSAATTYIKKTTTLQTADAIVTEATSQAATAAATNYIAKTTTYQTAASIVSTAEGYTDNKLTSYSTTTQTSSMISSYVTNNAYTLKSGIEIKAAGIEISGGKYVKIKSGGVINIESGSTFTVASDNLDINSGGLVVKQGVLKGTHYASDGTPLLTRNDIVISSSQPTGAVNRVWIKPLNSVTAEYRNSVTAKSNFSNGNITKTLTGTAATAQSGNKQYTLELPVYCSSTSGTDVPITVTATVGSNTVTFTGTIPGAYYSSEGLVSTWVLTMTATSSTWLATGSSISLTVRTTNTEYDFQKSVHGVDIGDIILRAVSTGSGGAGWKECEVKVYQG